MERSVTKRWQSLSTGDVSWLANRGFDCLGLAECPCFRSLSVQDDERHHHRVAKEKENVLNPVKIAPLRENVLEMVENSEEDVPEDVPEI
eukprot:2932957-Amphidinium_carterae.3